MSEEKVHSADKVVNESVKDFRSFLQKHGNQPGWEEAWKIGLTPWEARLGRVQVQPALRWACEEEKIKQILLPTSSSKKVLVPGCGRGQDVLYFANTLQLTSIGIDISQTAVERAKEYIETVEKEEKGELNQNQIQIVQADYLDPNATSGPHHNPLLQEADLVYDYTFFCALPPSLHIQWANAHFAALRKGGVLFCIVYPLPPPSEPNPDFTVGPPFLVTKQKYIDLLQDRFTLEFQAIPPNVPDHAKGRQEIMIWRKN